MGNLALAIILFAVSSVSATQYTVVRVIDGDTVVLRGSGDIVRLDLAYVDAPELGTCPVFPCQPFAREAQRFLEDRLLGRKVHVVMRGQRSKERAKGILFVHGKDINMELIKAGLAEVSTESLATSNGIVKRYVEAQHQAWSGKRGIWRLGGGHVCPRKWRERTKERSAMAALLYILMTQPKK